MTAHTSIAFEGKPIVKGAALGCLFFYREEKYPTNTENVRYNPEEELLKYHRAVAITKKEIRALLNCLKNIEDAESAAIFETHLLILEDPVFSEAVEEMIKENFLSAQASLESALARFLKILEESQDPFFMERAADLQDLTHKIIFHLNGIEVKIPDAFQDAIVCVKEVSPSMAAQGALKGVKGFVTIKGSNASHTSVVLKSRAIPHILVDDIYDLESFHGRLALLDGKNGVITIDPSETDIRLNQNDSPSLIETKTDKSDVLTADGWSIQVLSTFDGVEYSKELENGIGLYRTEFLLLHEREIAFCEERQLVLYQSILDQICPKKVVFRLFDLGGDKNFLQDLEPERRDLRSIRYLLNRLEILHLQLSSLLKAKNTNSLSILIPYVNAPEEVDLVRSEIKDLQKKLSNTKTVLLGAMIETPLADKELDQILERVDFLAIGTNDLTQALIEIHRDSPDFCLFQPALFRTIRKILEKAKIFKRQVSVCGEIVSNPVFTELLLGLGATDFSCSFHEIPQIKRKIMETRMDRAVAIAEKVLAAETPAEVKALLKMDP